MGEARRVSVFSLAWSASSRATANPADFLRLQDSLEHAFGIDVHAVAKRRDLSLSADFLPGETFDVAGDQVDQGREVGLRAATRALAGLDLARRLHRRVACSVVADRGQGGKGGVAGAGAGLGLGQLHQCGVALGRLADLLSVPQGRREFASGQLFLKLLGRENLVGVHEAREPRQRHDRQHCAAQRERAAKQRAAKRPAC